MVTVQVRYNHVSEDYNSWLSPIRRRLPPSYSDPFFNELWPAFEGQQPMMSHQPTRLWALLAKRRPAVRPR